MRASRRLSAVVILLTVASASPVPALSRAAGAGPRELIYVANATSGPVTAYGANSQGAVRPVRSVLAPYDPNAEWDPWGVAFDAARNLYVQSFLSDATSVVFGPGSGGVTKPLRKFIGGNSPDIRSIAVDSRGFEYVAGSEGPTEIDVEPPGAKGKPGDLYYVPPVRTITLDEQWNPQPSDLAVNSANQILAVVARPNGNAVEFFTGGARGDANPVRIITGPATGLGSCGQVCTLALAYSAFTGRIYVAVTDGAHARIDVFAGNASGDATPVQTIEGPATGLPGGSVSGLAISSCDGTIYAMVHAGPEIPARGKIDAYARLAQGNAHPLRSFTDARSAFTESQGLGITASGGC